MTKAVSIKQKQGDPTATLTVKQRHGETGGQSIARAVLEPSVRHGMVASAYVANMLRNVEGKPGLMDYAGYVQDAGAKAETGDLSNVSNMLAAQAVTLDSMFTEFSRRAAMNMGDYFDAAERYARLALKAQSNCRATLEALAKLHQPREQTVRHVHVNEGGQAIVADQFHQHVRGAQNADPAEQSHATRSTGTGTALLGQNADGDAVPITSGEGQAEVQNAWRD